MSDHHSSSKRTVGPEVKLIWAGDLPKEMKDLSRLIGLEPTLKVIAHYSGENIYIPKYETITFNLRNRLIRKEFDGSNLRTLASKYNLTTNRLRQILRDK